MSGSEVDGKAADLRALVHRLGNANLRCGRHDVTLLRSMLHNWRSMDMVTLASPRHVAEQLLLALDAVDIAAGRGEEIEKLDAFLALSMGAPPRKVKP